MVDNRNIYFGYDVKDSRLFIFLILYKVINVGFLLQKINTLLMLYLTV